MSLVISDLPWLPAAPADFRALCREITPETQGAGKRIQFLAGHALSAEQAASLSRAITRCAAIDLAPLTRFRLGLVSSSTADILSDGLLAGAARHGVHLDLVTTPYDQVMQEALGPDSTVNTQRCDAVWLAVDHKWLDLDRPRLADAEAAVEDAIARLAAAVEGIRSNSGAPLILQTLPTPAGDLFGSFDRRVGGSPRSLVRAVNERIVSLAAETGAYVLDMAGLAERIGVDRWFDPIQWNHYKLPFAGAYNEIVADYVGRLLGAIRGKTRKCLVLDLDNTVWGGVIGDDGIEGIKVGQGSAVGEAFLAVQRLALELRERGIFLAVSSKNTDEVARGPFREHTEMLLKEEHISVFQANWLDKPSNLEAVAKTLNIGLDALVFLDDNPAERAQMRAALPMVATPEIPSDPSWYAWVLGAAGYFESVAFSEEDRLRISAQAADTLRADVMTKSRDLGDYLGSLEMTLTLSDFDAKGRGRITQLINKSNQFNLTTRRYTEDQIADVAADPIAMGLQVRLADRFGDLGMIGVIICRTVAPQTWEIDTWLMSCRVLGRKVEEGMLDALVRSAKSANVQRVIGVYLPTAKNSMVSEHYTKLGFQPTEPTDEATRHSLDIQTYTATALPFTVNDKRAFSQLA